MAFICYCCNNEHHHVVGSHVVSTRTDRPVFNGSCEVSCPLVSCTNCSHVAVYPIPSQNDLHQFYRSFDYWQYNGCDNNFMNYSWLDNLTLDGGSWERFHRGRGHLQLILNHVNPSNQAKIIDLGSGLSPFLYHSRQQGFHNLYALEPSPEICLFLNRQGITTFPMLLETFITRKDLPQFDVMVLSHTLEHLAEPDMVLEGLRDLLSDRGMLLIVVPYKDHIRPYTAGLHFHFFNDDSLTHLLSKCGFKKVIMLKDRHLALDSVLIKMLHWLYNKRYANKRVTLKSLLENQRLQFMHRYFWRPLKRLMRLNINIFHSYDDLYVLAKRLAWGTNGPSHTGTNPGD
jgi:SAM-dependent methyltransferase